MEPSDILLLQETNIEEEALLSISMSKWKKNAGMVVSARGTSGGLESLWSDDKFLLKTLYATQHWIYTELQQLSSKISISLFNIYVPVMLLEKKDCWQSIHDVLSSKWPENIILAGDLNITLNAKEKREALLSEILLEKLWRTS